MIPITNSNYIFIDDMAKLRPDEVDELNAVFTYRQPPWEELGPIEDIRYGKIYDMTFHYKYIPILIKP